MNIWNMFKEPIHFNSIITYSNKICTMPIHFFCSAIRVRILPHISYLTNGDVRKQLEIVTLYVLKTHMKLWIEHYVWWFKCRRSWPDKPWYLYIAITEKKLPFIFRIFANKSKYSSPVHLHYVFEYPLKYLSCIYKIVGGDSRPNHDIFIQEVPKQMT